MGLESIVQNVTVWALPVIFGITLHEAAHAYAAMHFGDRTAYLLGRTSLNPLKHIDPIGTVLLPLIGIALNGFVFGWAKPVPINFSQLRSPKQDMFWVAAAGPAANLLMAVAWAVLLNMSGGVPNNFWSLVAQAGIQLNIVLMAVNLIPVPPLDGGRIAVSLLPNHLALKWAQIEPYGFFIVFFMLMMHMLDFILYPLMNLALRFVSIFA